MGERPTQDVALYPIGVVADLLNVHPATMRAWERFGVIQPARRSGRRFYSDNDLKQLRFIQRMTEEGLNLPAIRYQLRFYPCWHSDGCPSCMYRSDNTECTKPCWKEEGAYCQVWATEDLCSKCEFQPKQKLNLFSRKGLV